MGAWPLSHSTYLALKKLDLTELGYSMREASLVGALEVGRTQSQSYNLKVMKIAMNLVLNDNTCITHIQ